jgi:hypothetical protein
MKTYLDCLPCFLGQALRTGRTAGIDDEGLKGLLDEIGGMFRDIALEATPPQTARLIYGKIREISGNVDPYLQIKQESTRQALQYLPMFRQYIEDADDPLLMAVRLAIAGNVIDFGVYGEVDLETEVDRVIAQDFAVCDDGAFRQAAKAAGDVLYIGDNAGECVFDRLLIEQIGKPTTYAVRGVPVINDAVESDAVAAGIDQVARIVSSGTDAPGAVLNTCSDEFRRMISGASLIIAKGQGNYEALSREEAPVFFLLKAKCHVIAHSLGVAKDDIVLKRSDARRAGNDLPAKSLDMTDK